MAPKSHLQAKKTLTREGGKAALRHAARPMNNKSRTGGWAVKPPIRTHLLLSVAGPFKAAVRGPLEPPSGPGIPAAQPWFHQV